MVEYCKVLIIDDEFIMRQGLKHIIDWEKEGFEIVGEASNGKDGLDMIEKLHPHIILCDIVMPIMDGMDFSNMVQKMYPDIQIIILSGYDNFEYVKNTLLSGAVDYILKPTLNQEELIAVLQKTARKIPGLSMHKGSSFSKKKFLERYLLGFEDTFDRQLFEDYFTGTYYRIAAFYSGAKNGKGKDTRAALYEQAEHFVEKMTAGKGLLLVLKEEITCLIINFSAAQEAVLTEELEKFSEQMTLIDSQFFAVSSPNMTQMQKLRDFYQKKLLLFVTRAFYYEDMHFKVLDGTEELTEYREKFDYSRYSGLLTSKRYAEALDLLEEYVKQAVANSMDEYRLKNQTKNMLYNYLEYMESPIGDMDSEQLRYQLFSQVDETAYAKEFVNAFSNIKERLCGLLGRESGGSDKTIRKILAYIGNNYNQELDLAEIAQVFNFNYYYLSAYFNQHMKESFSDYLNRIRIEHACKLLREKQMPISQISGAVGYSDHSYFCRVFKKVTGATPSGWRRESR